MTPRSYTWIVLTMVAAMLLALAFPAGCKRSPDPAPAPKASAALIVNICGLGNSEGAPPDGIVAMEHILFPAAQIRYFKPNGWQADTLGYIRRSEYSKLVILGHSFGGDGACRTAAELPSVDLLILIDPVAFGAGNDTITVPNSVRRCLVFRRSSEGAGVVGLARRANINGRIEVLNVDAGHSTICDVNEVRAAISDAIRGAIQ